MRTDLAWWERPGWEMQVVAQSKWMMGQQGLVATDTKHFPGNSLWRHTSLLQTAASWMVHWPQAKALEGPVSRAEMLLHIGHWGMDVELA